MKQKFCLESVLPFRSINQSPINTSKAKQTFSFSKSPRFSSHNPTCPLNSYGGDQIQRKNSGAGIGYGKKYDLTQDSPVTPSCQKYRIKTVFDENNERRKGFSLKFSREQLAANSYINRQLLKTPGVGNYHYEGKRPVTQASPVYSLRQKTKITDKVYSIEPQNSNPSPAAYKNNPETYHQSAVRKFKTLNYSGPKSKRFPNYNNRLPGPGTYESDLAQIGRFAIASGHGSILFDQSKRVTEFDEAKKKSVAVPGPGSYRIGSQFGQYDGDVYGRQGKMH